MLLLIIIIMIIMIQNTQTIITIESCTFSSRLYSKNSLTLVGVVTRSTHGMNYSNSTNSNNSTFSTYSTDSTNSNNGTDSTNSADSTNPTIIIYACVVPSAIITTPSIPIPSLHSPWGPPPPPPPLHSSSWQPLAPWQPPCQPTMQTPQLSVV